MISLWRRGRPEASLSPLVTRRLRLVVITPELLDAETLGSAALSQALRVAVPQDWPPEHWEPTVRRFIGTQAREHPLTLPWHRYIVLRAGHAGGGWRRTLVGCTGAFPRRDGDVELGYSIVDSYQRRGFASEAARALTAWLLGQHHIRSVSAQTYDTSEGSIKVMKAAGMEFVGPGDEAGTVRYRRLRQAGTNATPDPMRPRSRDR